jgi:hypothetical protein
MLNFWDETSFFSFYRALPTTYLALLECVDLSRLFLLFDLDLFCDLDD